MESRTQMAAARRGEITAAMAVVAAREQLAPELVQAEVARGRLIIPANIHHLAGALEPMAIGKVSRVKINANIGTSAVTSDLDEEVGKLRLAVQYGADTVMDLSTGHDIDAVREAIIAASTVPIGTVPIYQAVLQGKELEELTVNDFLDVIEHQAKQGVDYMTLHAGILLEHLPLVYGRVTGIVSRGGSLHAVWMMHHRRQNPLYEHYDDVLDILRQYDVTISLGDSLRPGCLHDASDRAQFAELDTLGELTRRAWARDVQVMVEGPGHILLTRELRPDLAAALTARRLLLQSPAPVTLKYAWPKWDETFADPVSGKPWTFRQIVQGLIDNFLGKDSQWRWRLNDEVPIPKDAHPLTNPGLELTGPWYPLDMAFNALNSPAPMNMPDFEDASPPHFQPDGTPTTQPVGIFAALQNAKEIFEGRWTDRPYEVPKKGGKRAYKIDRPPAQWPTRFVRPPSIHVRYDHVVVDGQPAPGLIAVTVLWIANNYDSLKRAGTGVYLYIPKLQTPWEALIVEKLLARLEGIIGVAPGTIKIKILYEEGNAGRTLPAIAWVLRRRLLGTNVGRWDYLGSIIEMWKEDPHGIFPDPQTIGMASPNMIAYQRYNALMMLMAGMKNGELTQGGPIGGMAAVMFYQSADPYGRSQYNPLALRAMVIDKMRERLLGLIFVPDDSMPAGQPPTLEDILAKRANGRLYDCYRQSWVASPEQAYVAAGNRPLQAALTQLQQILDTPQDTVDVKGKAVATAASGLTDAERALLHSRGLLNVQGKITPWILTGDSLDTPEKIFTQQLWDSIYGVPKGDVTIEHIQHAFYMTANYGFQILNGNFAAAIDDYELKLRFMNDLATYRIDVSWLWTLAHHQAAITKDGYLKRPALTEDGVEPAVNAELIKAGTRFTRELFEKVWEYHNEWTAAFFAELDRRGEPGRFDRGKAAIIMDLLMRQLLSPRYIQHSARVLFVVGRADPQERKQILEAIFDLSREESVKRVESGALSRAALAAYDYVYDIFPGSEDSSV